MAAEQGSSPAQVSSPDEMDSQKTLHDEANTNGHLDEDDEDDEDIVKRSSKKRAPALNVEDEDDEANDLFGDEEDEEFPELDKPM